MIRLAGRTLVEDESGFGIVIHEADDISAAHAIMHADPALIEGVMHGVCFPFRIALPKS